MLFDEFKHLVGGFSILWTDKTEMSLRVFVVINLVQTRFNEGIVDLLVVLWACKKVTCATDEGDLEARDFLPIVKWWSIFTIFFLVELSTSEVVLFELIRNVDLSVMIQASVARSRWEEFQISFKCVCVDETCI